MSRKYDWPVLLEAHAKSGLSQAAFCRQNNVCTKYFSLQKSRAAKVEKIRDTHALSDFKNTGHALFFKIRDTHALSDFLVSANPTPPLPLLSR